MSNITVRPGSKTLHVTANFNALHLGEWAAKIQIFGFTE